MRDAAGEMERHSDTQFETSALYYIKREWKNL